MKFAKVIFYIAAFYGLVSLPPLYFMFDFIGRRDPPPITHPQFYYGFLGLALAWQLVFLVIATDPVRYRAMMIPAMVEKFGYVIACAVLHLQDRMSGQQVGTALPDLVLGTLFIASFLKTQHAAKHSI
jgi:hypothetical protein